MLKNKVMLCNFNNQMLVDFLISSLSWGSNIRVGSKMTTFRPESHWFYITTFPLINGMLSVVLESHQHHNTFVCQLKRFGAFWGQHEKRGIFKYSLKDCLASTQQSPVWLPAQGPLLHAPPPISCWATFKLRPQKECLGVIILLFFYIHG